MADLVFNRGAGRVTEWAERVEANDPTNAVFVIDLLATTGLESDATLRDKDDFGGLVSGTTNFATGTGWARKTLANGALTITYNDGSDRTEVDCANQTWTAVAGAADDVSKLVTGYDSDSGAGTDANILPATMHDFVIQPDGSDVTATITDFFRAAT